MMHRVFKQLQCLTNTARMRSKVLKNTWTGMGIGYTHWGGAEPLRGLPAPGLLRVLWERDTNTWAGFLGLAESQRCPRWGQ